MSEAFIYASIYEYLESELKDIEHPSKEQIIACKKQYYRLYHQWYNHQYQKRVHQYTLSFSKTKLQRIHQKKGSQSVSKFIYQSVEMALEKPSAYLGHKELLLSIQKMLMELMDLVDGQEHLDIVFERLEQLENQFLILQQQ